MYSVLEPLSTSEIGTSLSGAPLTSVWSTCEVVWLIEWSVCRKAPARTVW